MKFLSLLAVVAPVAQAGMDGYVRVPDGWLLHRDCIFNHPSGNIDPTRNYTCNHVGYRAPREQVYRMDTHLGDADSKQTSFNATWAVPELPKNEYDGVCLRV